MNLRYCESCKSSHMGMVPCGMTFTERLRSQTIDPSWMPAKTLKNYYDQDALNGTFGDDAEERMMDETEGLGAYTAEDRRRFPGVEAAYITHGGERTPVVDEQ